VERVLVDDIPGSFFRLWVEVGLSIPVEVPDVDSILTANWEYLLIVKRIENCSFYGVSVADVRFEKVGCRFLSLVVPDFEHAVISTCEQVPTVLSDVSREDSASVHSSNLADENTFEFTKSKEFDPLVFRHDDHLLSIVWKLK